MSLPVFAPLLLVMMLGGGGQDGTPHPTSPRGGGGVVCPLTASARLVWIWGTGIGR